MTYEITNLQSLRSLRGEWRVAGEAVALVPTMGALHHGHMALVEAAQRHAKRVIVSIFVNPLQFGPNEDFQKYPRTREADIALLRTQGADAVWLPDEITMYPPGFSTNIIAGSAALGMDGEARPGHFNGVATVVAKLFHQTQADMAFFGEKDYQQLCVIRQIVRDLNMSIAVHGIPTLREADGLALSSRNRYLSEQERKMAPMLYKILQQAKHAIMNNESVAETIENAKSKLAHAGFSAVDYLELRAADTLTPLERCQPLARLLAAAWLGGTRLIDNCAME